MIMANYESNNTPEDSPPHETTRLDNNLYYQEIIKYLKTKGSTTGKSWVKTHSTNYFLKDGELFYGLRKPRIVITEEIKQQEQLALIHIDPETGGHVGVKKMNQILQQTHFWRYSNQSIADYVRNCSECGSTIPLVASTISAPCVNLPWSDIELYCLRPMQASTSHQYLAIIFDPVSNWVSAKPVISKCFLPEFLFENMCNYGLCTCCVYTLNESEFSSFKERFSNLAIETDPVIDVEDLIKPSGEVESSMFTEKLSFKIESYIHSSGNEWADEKKLLNWLWKVRNESNNGFSAMKMMMGSRPTVICNKNKVPSKRRKQANFNCEICDQSFSSAVVLELHLVSHLPAEESTRTSNDGCKTLRSSKRNAAANLPHVPHPNGEASEVPTSATVAAVRAFIADHKSNKSREERQKRGEYRRYTPEIRESIVQHAMRHGTHDAARVFTSSLGFAVSYSTVRNFLKAHNAFSPQLKEEIGRYAAQCGIEATQKLYEVKLNKSISVALVRKFRRMYLRSINSVNPPSASTNRKRAPVVRHLFCTAVKEDIGKYAAQHGVAATVRHFTEKLQFAVKESTVRKFRKLFAPPPPAQPPPPPPSPTPPPPPPPPPPPSHHVPENNYYTQYSNYPPQYMYQTPQTNYPQSHQQSGYSVAQPVPPYPVYSSLPPPPQYQPMAVNHIPLPAYSRHWNEECTEDAPVPETHLLPPPALAPPPPPPSPPIPLCLNHQPTSGRVEPVKKTVPKKSTKKVSHRGTYATYSPEFRLEVGRYAAEHGCLETAHHFKDRVGHEIPESTVRGLREKYLSQKRNGNGEVSGLDTGPRGRPFRLGQHDSAVQECIKELKRSGEKVNAFVAIATARQVLLQREPSLLDEFGGPVKLTTNWAKSFLKRIGINSVTTNS